MLAEVIESAGIAPSTRAETLELEQFVHLTRVIENALASLPPQAETRQEP